MVELMKNAGEVVLRNIRNIDLEPPNFICSKYKDIIQNYVIERGIAINLLEKYGLEKSTGVSSLVCKRSDLKGVLDHLGLKDSIRVEDLLDVAKQLGWKT